MAYRETIGVAMDIFDPSFVEDASAYRVKVMVKNNLLLSAIEAAGYKSVAAFSKEIGWNQSRVGSLIGLREAPLKANGEFSDRTAPAARTPTPR
jgi:hypothetical protein